MYQGQKALHQLNQVFSLITHMTNVPYKQIAIYNWRNAVPLIYSYMFVWYVGHVRNVCQIYALHCTIGMSTKYSIAHALLGHQLKFTTLSHECLL